MGAQEGMRVCVFKYRALLDLSCSYIRVDVNYQAPENVQDVRALFDAWKRVHNKTYASAMENEVRSDIFHANARIVAAHNAKNDVSFTMELNQFADLSWYDS